MKNGNLTTLALALLALAVTASQARAQSVYTTPYAFTNFAGLPGFRGTNDGTGNAARFNHVTGVAVDGAGNVYVADTNKRLSKGTPPASLASLQFVARSLAVSNGAFHALLTGPSSSNAVLEASDNLQSWTPFETNALPPGGLNVTVLVGTNQGRFFRARLTP